MPGGAKIPEPTIIYLTWDTTDLTMTVGGTASTTVSNYISNYMQYLTAEDIDALTSSVATSSVDGTTHTVTFTGVAAGTITIPANTTIQSPQSVVSTNALTITVVAEDESYLNKRGLAHFWDNIDDLKLDTSGTAYRTSAIPYGECDNTSTSTVFTATVPGITELRDGVCMLLKNGVVTSASGFTININGLGAKPSYSNMAAATADTTIFNINYTMLFIYDSTRVAGGCWVCYRGYNSDTNTIGYQVRTNSQSLPMSSITYRYRLLFTSADGTKYVPATNSTSTNATTNRTVCQDKINPFGRIFYYGTTASVAAGSRPAVGNLWEQYALTLGYSFAKGSALTMTSWKPVYLKCAPQTDGSAIIDSTTPWVQDLPTTEDGKIYIFLGIAYSATQVELQLDHPVYWFKGGRIRPYTDSEAVVTSFNGSTGAVTYTAPVTSVNGNTGVITGLQTTSNLVTSVTSASTDNQYPSAKLLYDTVGDVETILQALNNGGGAQ